MPGRCGNRKGTWQEIVRCCLPPATSVVRLFRAVQTKCFVLKLRHPADDYLKARSPVACRATLPTAAKRRQDARGGWAIATDLAVGPTLGRCRRWTLRALIGLGGWDGLRGDHGRHRKRRRGPWDRDAGPGPCGSPRPRRARPTCRPRCGGGLPDRPQRLRAEHSAGAVVAGRRRPATAVHSLRQRPGADRERLARLVPVHRRACPRRAVPRLSVPQTATEGLSLPDWQPRFPDHLYLSYTNVVAFSPTDTLPLTSRVKGLMALQSIISLAVLVVVLARVINILPS